jgi:molybdopterin-guanine dinucleotide biosynthesis protein A
MQRPDPGRPPRAGKPGARGQVGAGPAGEGRLILGAVIAGGAATRFGSDKALALLDGKPLIDHAADALRAHVDALVLCGRTREGWTSLPDLPRPGLGPLGGIAAALAYAQAHGFASVLTIGCDMPRVPEELLKALSATSPSYCADAPILGHWDTNASDALLRHAGLVPASTTRRILADAKARHGGPRNKSGVAGGKDPALSIRRWAETIGATPIPAPSPLANVNTPADFAAL